jgi:hypothetical protein
MELFRLFQALHLVCFISVTLALDKSFSREHIAKCEVDALRLGTSISDTFNAPIDRDWTERVHQNYIAKHLGFAPWLSKGVKNSGKTLTNDNIDDIRKAHGWLGHNSTDSPYAVLNKKWIYMYGDSTTRQVWASFGASFQNNKFERNAKEWTRQYCNKQGHRINHVKNGKFPNEGWEGPCGVNEITCYISGFGDGGLLTFDWKHFPYEDYDDYVFGNNGIFNIDPIKAGKDAGRKPDILTLQTGMHTCWHAHPDGKYSKNLNGIFNQTMYDEHIEGIEKLFNLTRNAINRRSSGNITYPETTTTVIVLTSGATHRIEGSISLDHCIKKLNRITTTLANKYGFAVLDRGEIEQRLMYKTIGTNGLINNKYNTNGLLEENLHLPMPAQTIIATCLLNMITCLHSDPKKLGIKSYLDHSKFGGGGIEGNLYNTPNL